MFFNAIANLKLFFTYTSSGSGTYCNELQKFNLGRPLFTPCYYEGPKTLSDEREKLYLGGP